MTVQDIDGLVLNKTGSNFYQTDTKKTFRLQPVDRDYPGRKRPAYYLQQMQGGKAEYISGVFETADSNKMSMDIKDRLGIKTYFDITIQGSGQTLIINRRKQAYHDPGGRNAGLT